ncbi:valine--tRNA ligase [Humisphaera borealis]|uniref:Valine--tRNA ligase n=1 Tax=Humisphaera borealis TaxID=2807512 RepID=A0A7M2X1B9_9BACT|nr:valine--tRNA ligase [Humisphaera borealis]QOV90530.1 valine--tRNA ligase [Humisphaera borealis]
MPTELSKTYEPSAVESEAYAVWLKEGCFHAEPANPGNPYAIVIPPPNVTAALHLGHALNNTIQDILTRYHRMAGDNTCWLPGTDHAGIATQTIVDRRLQAEGQPALKDFKRMEAEGGPGREQFLTKVQAWKDEYELKITDQLKAMGCSCDWERQAFTMDPPRAKAVREAFYRLFKDGLIYRGKRLVNWDPVTQTALADDEVEMEDVDGQFYYLRYPLVDAEGASVGSALADAANGDNASDANTNVSADASAKADPTYVVVATTRPETMLGDTAVAINPKDPRAASLRGKFIKLPIVNRIIPIVEDDYVVLSVAHGGDPEDSKAQFATGFLKVTPAHDPNDYEIGRRHNLAVINVMAPDASISDKHGWTDVGEAGFVLGKSREEARKLIVKWFKEQGLLEEMKPYKHAVGHSYRSHVPIEPYLSDQWYCKVTDDRLAGAALRAMAPEQFEQRESSPKADGTLRFYPARYAKTFQTWHENIRDWCISRQLWWGHRIPVWGFTNHDAVDSKTDEQLSGLIEQLIRLKNDGRVAIRHADRTNELAPIDLQHSFICVREEDDRPALELLNQLGYTQDPDVLDTWFSSGLWPLSTLNWPTETAELAKWNPSNVLTTAREIITLWVSRMVMFNLYLRDCLPFTDVFIHAMIQDGEGQKMSKTLGNGVDPLDIIQSHGADAMRYTLAAMTTHTQDLRMPVDLVCPHTGETFKPQMTTISGGYKVAAPIQSCPSDPKKKIVSSYGYASGQAKPTADMPVAKNTSSKFDLGRNFCNKIWNAARYALGSLEAIGSTLADPTGVDESKWSMTDRWIVSRFNRTVAECNQAIADYRFDVYAKSLYDFFWRDLCDWYLEAIKPAMRDSARAPQTANILASLLDGSLRLMHPAIPFITETIWWKLNEVRPQRGLPGRIDCPPSPRLVTAAWPKVGDVSEAAEHIFPKVQELITGIRQIRNERQVNPKQVVAVSINCPSERARSVEMNREVIEGLSLCTLKEVGPDVQPPAGAAKLLSAGCEIYVEGLVDEAAEKVRIEKRREELTKLIAGMEGRLSNEQYLAKAPPKLVQQTKDQMAAMKAELERLG